MGDPHSLKEVRLVGRYALGVDWQDHHGSIFPFEYLRDACPCRACREPRARGGAEAWPAEITREEGGLKIRWRDGHESVFGGRRLRELCRCVLCTGGR